MKTDQIQELEKVQRIEGVDVFDIQERDGKTVLKLYPAKATDETKTVVLDNGDEEPINVSDVPVRQVSNEEQLKVMRDNNLKQMEMEYITDEEIVLNDMKRRLENILDKMKEMTSK